MRTLSTRRRGPRRLPRVAVCAAGIACFAASSLTTIEARADDFAEAFIAVSGGALLFGADVAFTAVNVRAAIEQEDLEEGWMIAQTIVTAPQAVLGDGLMAFGASQDSDQEIVALFLPASIWLNSLATFSTWSLASRQTEVDDRLGVSWMLGANLTLTAAALGGTLSSDTGHVPSLAVSVPELLIAIPETIGCAYAISGDDRARGGWIALTAWSSALVIHGTVSLILEGVRGDVPPPDEEPIPIPIPEPDPEPLKVPEPEPPVKVVPEPEPPVKVVPEAPQNDTPRPLDDFLNPSPRPPAPRRSSQARPSKRVAHASFAPKITPTTLTEDGRTFVPGVMVFGRF